jgi:hypothetical protein
LLIGLIDGQTQPRIACRIAAAKSGGNGNFLYEPSENLATLGILRGFLVFDIRPLAMTSHNATPHVEVTQYYHPAQLG